MNQLSQIAIPTILTLAAATALFVAERARQRPQREAKFFAVVMLAGALWLAGYAAELLLPGLTLKLFAARVQYVGITILPPFWLLFALSLTSRRHWVNARTALAILIVPGITIILAWTSSSHGWLWSSVTLDSEASASGLVLARGPWFWIHTAYLYVMLLGSNIALVVLFARALRLHRRQASLMLVGLMTPWLANIAYLSLGSATSVDPTPLALAFSGFLLAWGLWRWRLLDVRPVPRARSIESMRDGVIVLDEQHRIVDFNAAAVSMLGFDGSRALGKAFDQGVPQLAGLPEISASLESHRFEASGSPSARILEVRVSPFDNAHALANDYWLLVIRDVTAQDLAERRLRAAEERFRTLIEQMPAVTYVREWSDRLVPTYMSPQVEDLLGYDPAAICTGAAPTWEQLIYLEDLEDILNLHRRAMEQRRTFAAEYRLRDASGRVVWVRDEAGVIAGGEGQLPQWQGVIVDISNQKQLESELERYAFYDALTGLPNRALLIDRLRQGLSRVQRQGKLVGVLFIDLDGFKIINDTLGHSEGDRVLRRVARRLQDCLRAGDTVGRLGGDEFVVVIESVVEPQDVVQIANRIIRNIQRPMTSAGQEVAVSCSIGVRTSLPQDRDPEDLIRDADIAMYWAKRRGRSRVVTFERSMLTHRWNRLGLEAELRAAVREEQLQVYYQPIVSMRTGRVTGFEALLRWIHPDRGEILPGEFLPTAEECGLMIDIDRWVLKQACRQVARWQARLPDRQCQPVSISVNITPMHILQPSLLSDIRDALDTSGLSGDQLILEITESHTMRNTAAFGARLDEIAHLGPRVIIDDFGTGYSALAYLRQFSIAGIKIDRSFVSGLGTRPEDTSLVNAVVSLARSFGLKVTAEGIETDAQWADLGALGADYGQGYLIARPLPVDDIEAYISTGRFADLAHELCPPRLRVASGE